MWVFLLSARERGDFECQRPLTKMTSGQYVIGSTMPDAGSSPPREKEPKPIVYVRAIHQAWSVTALRPATLSDTVYSRTIQLGLHFAVLRCSSANKRSCRLQVSIFEGSLMLKIVEMSLRCQKQYNRIAVTNRWAVTEGVKRGWTRFRRSTALSDFCRSAVLDPLAVHLVANSDDKDIVSGLTKPPDSPADSPY